MTRGILIEINPQLLRYARERVGLNIEEAEAHSGVGDLAVLEKSGGYLNLSNLRQLSSLYKRAIPFFLLPETPKEKPIPTELRTIASQRNVHFSYETWLAFNRGLDIQAIAKELADNIGYKNKLNFKYINLENDPENEALNFRKHIKLTLEIQRKWKNSSAAYTELRKMIEEIGILTAQWPFPFEEARGFAINDLEFPMIMVNSKDWLNGQIFTLCHELAHILLNHSGVVQNDLTLTSRHRTIESFCNHFAGAVLVPKKALLDKLPSDINFEKEEDDSKLQRLATFFRVSKEAILRRLVILEIVKQDFYKTKRAQWEVEFKKLSPRKIFASDPAKQCLTRNGKKVLELGFKNYNSGKIGDYDFGSYFNVKAKHISNIEHIYHS